MISSPACSTWLLNLRLFLLVVLRPLRTSSSTFEPELPATLEGVTNPSTAAPPAAIPTAAWWLEAPLPLSETLVASLSRRLQASGELSPQDRIRLAYQRGQQGAAIRRGDRDWFEGNRCILRNRCYVVLLGGNGDPPFFTWDFAPTNVQFALDLVELLVAVQSRTASLASLRLWLLAWALDCLGFPVPFDDCTSAGLAECRGP